MKRSTPLRTRKPLRRLTRLRARSKTNKYRRRERDFEFMGFVKRQPCIVRVLPPVAAPMGGLHTFKPHRCWSWLCDECGYAEHERLKHFVVTPCSGPVEADHMGARGIGQKADDRTCVPMCQGHHRERHDHAGTFRPLTKAELRDWRARAIEHTQTEWEHR